MCRYVERNALRANLVPRAETWRWGSLWHRVHGTSAGMLDDGPVALPAGWVEQVNAAQTELELTSLRRALIRGSPFGGEAWRAATAKTLGLSSTLMPRGRPRLPAPGAR